MPAVCPFHLFASSTCWSHLGPRSGHQLGLSSRSRLPATPTTCKKPLGNGVVAPCPLSQRPRGSHAERAPSGKSFPSPFLRSYTDALIFLPRLILTTLPGSPSAHDKPDPTTTTRPSVKCFWSVSFSSLSSKPTPSSLHIADNTQDFML